MDKKALTLITRILFDRYLKAYETPITGKKKKAVIQVLNKAFEEGRLVYDIRPDNTLGYFYTFKKVYMGEFEEHFFYVSDFYCSPKFRRIFYSRLKKSATEMKKASSHPEKVTRVVIEASSEDKVSQRYFQKRGVLTYIQLVGNTKKSLSLLRKMSLPQKGVKIALLQKKDITKLIELDRKAHLEDKSSRMHKLFQRPNARKSMRTFYNGLFKNKSFLVIKVNGKLAGNLGYFLDKKRKLGLIASVFIAKDYQGMGLSKLLYLRALEVFNEHRLPHYLGATTTKGVLAIAQDIGRKDQKWSYLLKI